MTTESSSADGEISNSSDEGFEIIEKPNESLCSVSADTYLSLPGEGLALSSPDKLKNAIESCKSAILSIPENSDEKKWLVRRLIELKIRLENIKDQHEEAASESSKEESYKVVLGHHFSLQSSLQTSNLLHYCDRCSGIIWNVHHKWYLCSDCGYKCHLKCLGYVCRVCAHVVVSENPDFIMDICPEPEDGLANQNYRCAECLAHTFFVRSWDLRVFKLKCDSALGLKTGGKNVLVPRLCDYTGKYYCSTCHWNSTSVIPARVILNWDFRERFVCRSSKQILKLMFKLPILKLEELNPVLFACIEELVTVKELRRQLMQIKRYLTSCKSALEGQRLWQFGDKLHFLENEDRYCLQDLIDLKSGELIKYLNKIRDDFTKHIKVDCEVCKGRGFFCEFCNDKKIIFPFEENAISCFDCQSTFHLFCWVKNSEQCPKCHRIQQRLLKSETDPMCNSTDS